MKTFGIPKMAVVHLANEDVITSSYCTVNLCEDYFCDDCQECNGAFDCWSVNCKIYTQP